MRRCREHNCIVTGPMIYNAAESFAEKELYMDMDKSEFSHRKVGLKSSK